MAARYVFSRLLHRLAVEPPMRVYWCRGCDAGFLLPRPTPELLAKLYGEEYFSSYNSDFPYGQPPNLMDRLRIHLAYRFDKGIRCTPEMIEEILGTRSVRICELGCGNGDVLIGFANRGFTAVGIEPDRAAVHNARAKGLKMIEGTAEQLPDEIPGAPFDVVIMCHVLEHCLDPNLAIRNALGLLRPDGFLVIEVPNCSCFQFQCRGVIWFHSDPGRHVNYFTPGSLRKLFQKQDVRHYRNYYYPVVSRIFCTNVSPIQETA